MVRKKVRSQEMLYYQDTLGQYPLDDLMSGLRPDGDYTLIGINIACVSEQGAGVVYYIAFAKNIAAREHVGAVAGTLFKDKVGVFLHYEPDNHAVAAGTKTMNNIQYNLPGGGMYFDKDDKLNMHVYQAATQNLTWVVDLLWVDGRE